MELIVVMSVTLMLTGLMLPALVQIRENAHRVVCSSNLRQIGLATVLWADDHNRNLPPSVYGEDGGPKQEMMAVHRGGSADNWEGFGWLHAMQYFKGPQVLYCPSHTGEHTFERYERFYDHPDKMRIYANYHYAGPWDWERNVPRRLDRGGEELVIASDGLRSARDFNHKVGLNVLHGDNSVNWVDDPAGRVKGLLPPDQEQVVVNDGDSNDEELYAEIWSLISGTE